MVQEILRLRIKQQVPRRRWRYWLLIAGRGFGKTLGGSHCVYQWIVNKKKSSIAFIGGTMMEVMNIMVYGVSGLIPWLEKNNIKFIYNQFLSKIIIPQFNVKIFLFSADRPYKIRGFQFDGVWIDEFCKFKKPQDIIDQVHFSTRLGNPQYVITSTPGNNKTLGNIIKHKKCILTQGSSYENKRNLSKYYRDIIQQYEGSTLGHQEIHGKMIDNNNSPWQNIQIKYGEPKHKGPLLLGIDPGIKNRNETGIILGTIVNGTIYVLEDYSLRDEVTNWIDHVVNIVHSQGVNTIAIETNQGGDLLSYVLKNKLKNPINIKNIFSQENKYTRHLMVSHLYKNNKILHSKILGDLEYQMFNYQGSKDRLDAMAFMIHGLLEKEKNNQDFCFIM